MLAVYVAEDTKERVEKPPQAPGAHDATVLGVEIAKTELKRSLNLMHKVDLVSIYDIHKKIGKDWSMRRLSEQKDGLRSYRHEAERPVVLGF